MRMPYSLKHRAKHLAPIERSNRAAIHLRVRAILEAQESTRFPSSFVIPTAVAPSGKVRA